MITKTQWVQTGYSGKFSGCLIMKIQWVPSRRWHHGNSVGALQAFRCIRSLGKFSGCPHAQVPLSVIFPIQCNNGYYSGPSGWVKRSHDRARETRYPNSCFTWFQFSLLFYLFLRKRFIFSILIKLKRSYFEVQTKQLFDSSVYWTAHMSSVSLLS